MSWDSSQLNLIDNEHEAENLSTISETTEILSNSQDDSFPHPPPNFPPRRTPMVGFITFLVATKITTFMVYTILLVVADIFLHVSFFWTVFAFSIAEVVLIGITMFHLVHPTQAIRKGSFKDALRILPHV